MANKYFDNWSIDNGWEIEDDNYTPDNKCGPDIEIPGEEDLKDLMIQAITEMNKEYNLLEIGYKLFCFVQDCLYDYEIDQLLGGR